MSKRTIRFLQSSIAKGYRYVRLTSAKTDSNSVPLRPETVDAARLAHPQRFDFIRVAFPEEAIIWLFTTEADADLFQSRFSSRKVSVEELAGMLSFDLPRA